MIYGEFTLWSRLFPNAERYYRQVHPHWQVHEAGGRTFSHTERHLQCLWFDERLRPEQLKTSHGEPVVVEQAGRWNLEAGPDFRDAVLLIGREKRRIAGDAEIHIVSNDWKNHGHVDDPRYANVRFHITWFAGPIHEELFPPGTVHIALYDRCATDLESIDVTAYPYEASRCEGEFPRIGKGPDETIQWLESAGEERLRQKAVRMALLMEQQGGVQALYEEMAAALGYKYNKAPFRQLTQRLPIERLHTEYGSDWKTVYSVLLGLSGLLPRQPSAHWPPASRAELRGLWDSWWREQHKWEEIEPVARAEWRLAGLRPLNHPVRRLCALAQWTAAGLFFNPPRSVDSLEDFQPSFWGCHTGWSGKETPAELVGQGRARTILINVLSPYFLAKGQGDILKKLPVEPMNSVIRETAYTLFGPDHSPKLYRTALARQGLIQIFNDFILTGRLQELECL